MELSSRIVNLKIKVKEDVTIPPFIHSAVCRCRQASPTECFILFLFDEHITEVLELGSNTELMGIIWK